MSVCADKLLRVRVKDANNTERDVILQCFGLGMSMPAIGAQLGGSFYVTGNTPLVHAGRSVGYTNPTILGRAYRLFAGVGSTGSTSIIGNIDSFDYNKTRNTWVKSNTATLRQVYVDSISNSETYVRKQFTSKPIKYY